ncbi:MAG: hypothetical protein RIQ81_2648 [Pseudomonadota bacterium]|jgi:predicted nuclease with TOPRIM domain
MKFKSAVLFAAIATMSVAGSAFGEEAPAAAESVAPKKVKSKSKKTPVDESDEALQKKVESLQKELASLKAELAKNAGARTEQAQTRMKEEVDGLEKRLAELQVEIKKLGDTSSEDIKSTVKKNVGSALTSAGDLLKKLGKEVSK